MLKDIRDVLKDEIFILGLVSLFLLVIPGVTFIYYFDSNLFTSLNILKLIFLSLAFITPLMFLNFILLTIVNLNKQTNAKSEDTSFLFLFSTIFSSIPLYLSLLITYLSHLNFRESLYLSLLIELLILLVLTLISIISRRRS